MGGQMLFSPTKEEIQLAERKHIFTLETVTASIKRPRQIGRITFSLGKGSSFQHVTENARINFTWMNGGK